MSYVEELNEALKEAMRTKDQVRLKVIRELKTRVKNWEIDQHKEATDETFIKLVQTAVKQRREAISLYEKGGRTDLVDSEQAELKILDAYLPQMLSSYELTDLVDEVIAETGAQTPADIGKVMPLVMKRAAGRADGRLVQEIVRAKLKEDG